MEGDQTLRPTVTFQARIAVTDHQDEVTTVVPLTPTSQNWFDVDSKVCWHCERPFYRGDESSQSDKRVEDDDDEVEDDDDADGDEEEDGISIREDVREHETLSSDDSETETEAGSDESEADGEENEDEEDDDNEFDADGDMILPIPYVTKVNTVKMADPMTGQMLQQRNYIGDGYFCSFRCARAWSAENRDISGAATSNSTANAMLFADMTGLSSTEYHKISAAPPKRALKRYGGPFDYNQFDAFTDRSNRSNVKSLKILRYPSISMRHHYLEEIRLEDIDKPDATKTIILEPNPETMERRSRKRRRHVLSPSHLQLNNKMLELQRKSMSRL